MHIISSIQTPATTHRKAGQGLVETNVLHNQQIGTLPLEQIVFLFLYDKVDIPRFSTRNLIRHSTKRNLLIVAHALFNVHLHDLAFVLHLGLVSLPVTFVAGSLHLRNHSGSKLSHLHNGSLSVAGLTFGRLSDNDLSVDGQFDLLAIVQILQGDLEGVVQTGPLPGTGASATAVTEKHAKQVFPVRRRGPAFVFDALQTVLVVDFALFRVGQNFICRIDFLKDMFCSYCLVW